MAAKGNGLFSESELERTIQNCRPYFAIFYIISAKFKITVGLDHQNCVKKSMRSWEY